jgi:predicted heme/steroid binding protein
MEGAPAIIVYGVWAAVILFALKQIRDRFFTIDVGRVAQVPKRNRRTPPEKRDYNAEELKQYDGTDPTKPILLGVKGKIYDVSAKEEFYGPGGAYSAFAGRDASRALAKGT